jgi:FtsH-binding integral membrane protein
MLSIGLVVSELTGDGSILLWLLWALAGAVFLNVFVRIGMVCRHFKTGDPADS